MENPENNQGDGDVRLDGVQNILKKAQSVRKWTKKSARSSKITLWRIPKNWRYTQSLKVCQTSCLRCHRKKSMQVLALLWLQQGKSRLQMTSCTISGIVFHQWKLVFAWQFAIRCWWTGWTKHRNHSIQLLLSSCSFKPRLLRKRTDYSLRHKIIRPKTRAFVCCTLSTDIFIELKNPIWNTLVPTTQLKLVGFPKLSGGHVVLWLLSKNKAQLWWLLSTNKQKHSYLITPSRRPWLRWGLTPPISQYTGQAERHRKTFRCSLA